MTRALVIGKFMPLHNGHLALIEFAASHADEVIVSMSYTPHDTIDPLHRFKWINEIFTNRKNILPFLLEDNFDNDLLPLTERTKIWAGVMRKVYPKIDVVVSSEAYGEPFAANLQATHLLFDADRKKIPVSASLIREKPFRYWEFIPPVVRPYFVKKICFYGSESTGKSFMAQKLAQVYNTEFVPEVAREIVTSNEFTEADIIKIGYAQIDRINEKIKTANKILLCDTDTITTQIYSQQYLKTVPAILFELEKQVHYDYYFLFDIDVPWVADHLRDLGGEREKMLQVFKAALDQRGIAYKMVHGNYQQREDFIRHEINKILEA
ncbi:MAG: AAA family ATPase [Cyclobacteriaceae bacterium]|nr:AAA family ATPase [Cyclobacteriaceae bacterium]